MFFKIKRGVKNYSIACVLSTGALGRVYTHCTVYTLIMVNATFYERCFTSVVIKHRLKQLKPLMALITDTKIHYGQV